jgi:hypothetical protein
MAAVDALVVGGHEVWVVVARPGDDPAEMLWAGDDGLRVCRAILDHDMVLLGPADPESDPLLSELLRGEDDGPAQ